MQGVAAEPSSDSGPFADPDTSCASDDVLACQRAQLVAALAETLHGRGLTEAEAAKLCRTDHPTLSNVLSGRAGSLTIDTLMRWLAALGRPVELDVRRDPVAAIPASVRADEPWFALADDTPIVMPEWMLRADELRRF